RSLHSLGTDLPLRSSLPLRALCAGGPRVTLGPRRPRQALGSNVPGVAFVALRPHGAYGSERHVKDRDLLWGRMVVSVFAHGGSPRQGQTVGARKQPRGQRG
ncbi:MAG TPA: hypothetical protein VKI41_07380, partial [Vicinamibacteria bacterium]|nr:hypothetical protein [Vicinamibacteria bacterium]